MHIVHVADISDIPLSREAWNRLVSQNETNTLFLTHEWFSSWYDTFSVGHELCLLLVYEGENPIGFAPLVVCKHDNKHKTLQFAGYCNADYLDFVAPTSKKQVINLIFNYLVDEFNDWDRILLYNIPSESSTSAYIEEACNRLNLPCLERNAINCPYLQIEGHQEEVDRLINKYRNKRPFNYFSKQGELIFRRLSQEDIDKHLPVFFSQHIQRWEGTPFPSLFNNHLNQLLYKNVAQQFVDTDWLHFSVVELDGKPISYHYGFDYDDKYYWYKPSFNTDYSAHSPGILMVRYLIESALIRQRKELDFTIGDEPFKKRFTNSKRHNINLDVFRKKKTYWFHNTLFHASKIKRHVYKT
ncbi:MAG: GNAT family N-acetyltransferase [Candidatus Thiodiazotropha sp.]